jgi:hypothetical protein
MKILLFPVGYDPQVASFRFDDLSESEKKDLERFRWSDEEHERMKELGKKGEVVECEKPPVLRWYVKIEEGQ